MKFQKPSKIQEKALPLLLANPYVSQLDTRSLFVLIIDSGGGADIGWIA